MRCVDKIKLLAFIDDELNFHMDECDGEYAVQKWLLINNLHSIRRRITSGELDIKWGMVGEVVE